MKKIKTDETQIRIFNVKYTLYEKEVDNFKIYEVIVDDILINGISVKIDLNDVFNTYKSQFCRTLIHNIYEKENLSVSIMGGLSGYWDDL